MNIKYSSIFYELKDIKKIDYLKEFNISFNKIKKLTIENVYDDKVITKKQYNNFFEILFSFKNVENRK